MANNTTPVNRKESDINLIWKHTHPDNKSIYEGIKTVRYPAPYFCSGSIEGMPESCYQDALKYARKREVRECCDNALRPIMKKHGLLEHFESTQQWRDSVKDVKTFAGFKLGDNSQELDVLMSEIVAADIIFPIKG